MTIYLGDGEAVDLMTAVRAAVREAVAEALQTTAANKPPEATAPEQLLTIRQAAQLLDISQGCLHEWKRKGLLPYHRLGGRTYFKQTDVVASLQARRRTPKGKGN